VSDDIGITVRLFASLRDAAGSGSIDLRLPPATPVGAVWSHLPDPVRALGLPDGLRYALNHEWTVPGAALRDGDEVALVLPVSGG
jgi:molybdopterin converting factor small subunit